MFDPNMCSGRRERITLTYREVVAVCDEAAVQRDPAAADAAIKALSTLSPNDGRLAVEAIDQTTEGDWTWRLLMRRALSTCAPTADTST